MGCIKEELMKGNTWLITAIVVKPLKTGYKK